MKVACQGLIYRRVEGIAVVEPDAVCGNMAKHVDRNDRLYCDGHARKRRYIAAIRKLEAIDVSRMERGLPVKFDKKEYRNG